MKSRLTPLLAFAFCFPVHAATIQVPAGGDLQAALNSAAPGDEIVLQAGATYKGAFRLPAKPGAAYITIRSSAISMLPPGVRVTGRQQAPLMAKLEAPNQYFAVRTDPGAHHYRLIGLEIAPPPGVYTYGLVLAGEGNETSLTQLPRLITLDRVWIHGDPVAGGKRGIAMNGIDISVENSRVNLFMSTWQDAQAICGWNGPGPYRIINNFLSATGENIMFSGPGTIPGVIASNILVERNRLFKPLRWKPSDPKYAGKNWIVKNLFELKAGKNVTLNANILENCWMHSQNGTAIVLNGMNRLPISNIKMTGNIIRNVEHVVDAYSGSGKVDTLLFHNNLFQKVNGGMFIFLNRIDNITITHNTSADNGGIMYVGELDALPADNFVFCNNIFLRDKRGLLGSSIGEGQVVLEHYYPGYIFRGNVLIDAPSALYPIANYFPATTAGVGFTNLAGGDYNLTPSSPYKYRGTDGRDPGIIGWH